MDADLESISSERYMVIDLTCSKQKTSKLHLYQLKHYKNVQNPCHITSSRIGESKHASHLCLKMFKN